MCPRALETMALPCMSLTLWNFAIRLSVMGREKEGAHRKGLGHMALQNAHSDHQHIVDTCLKNVMKDYENFRIGVKKMAENTALLLQLSCVQTKEQNDLEIEITNFVNSEKIEVGDRLGKCREHAANLRAALGDAVRRKKRWVFAENYVRTFIDMHSFAAHVGAALCAFGVCVSLFVLFMQGEPLACKVRYNGDEELNMRHVPYRTMIREYEKPESAIIVSKKDYENARDAIGCAHICWSACIVSFGAVVASALFHRLLAGLIVANIACIVAVALLASLNMRRRFFLYIMSAALAFFLAAAALYFSFDTVLTKITLKNKELESLSSDVSASETRLGEFMEGACEQSGGQSGARIWRWWPLRA
jgi:hypothetical protein